MADQIRIVGLKEFASALRKVDGRLAREMTRAHKRIAEDLVAAPARRLAQSLGDGHVHLARPGVISPRGTQAGASIALNAGRYPDAFAQEFGSGQTSGWLRDNLVRGHHSVLDTYGQFDPWRGNQWTDGPGLGVGYALHPTIRAALPRIREEYADRIAAALKEAFPQ